MLRAQLNSTNAQFSAINQSLATQIQNTNAAIGYQTYTPIQQSNGTWVRCIRTSSYTISCIAY